MVRLPLFTFFSNFFDFSPLFFLQFLSVAGAQQHLQLSFRIPPGCPPFSRNLGLPFSSPFSACFPLILEGHEGQSARPMVNPLSEVPRSPLGASPFTPPPRQFSRSLLARSSQMFSLRLVLPFSPFRFRIKFPGWLETPLRHHPPSTP